jgi:hypothetical protein
VFDSYRCVIHQLLPAPVAHISNVRNCYVFETLLKCLGPLSVLIRISECLFVWHGRITIKVMGWNQFAANKPLLLGIHKMELRLLARLGYEVYVVRFLINARLYM